MPDDPLTLLRTAIELSGLSNRKFATDVLIRDERTVRRWLAGDPIPAAVLPFLRRYIAERDPSPRGV